MNSLSFQYFVTRNLSQGWYLNTAPIITTNWEADNGDRTIVPLGGGFGRIFKMGPQAVNASVGAYVNAKRPDHLPSPTWQLRMHHDLSPFDLGLGGRIAA